MTNNTFGKATSIMQAYTDADMIYKAKQRAIDEHFSRVAWKTMPVRPPPPTPLELMTRDRDKYKKLCEKFNLLTDRDSNGQPR